MSVQTLSTDALADGAADPVVTGPDALRILAVAAVCLGVAALAAATFVLSYSPIRAVVLQAGITPRLARGYPLLLDAMLVIVLAAVLALRGAGLPSRMLAWVTLLLVMAVAAGADALHTAGHSMPHQAAAITAAVLPFVLVLVAFALLLVMLRYARLRRLADAAESVSAYGSGWALEQPAVAQVAAAQLAVAQPAEAALGAFEHGLTAPTPEDAQPELQAGPTAAEAISEPAAGTTPYPADTWATGYDSEPEYPALTAEAEAAHAEPEDDDGPVFHRLFSAPVPVDIETAEAEAADIEPTEV
jgi:uncharacterized protein DUF2637